MSEIRETEKLGPNLFRCTTEDGRKGVGDTPQIAAAAAQTSRAETRRGLGPRETERAED